MEESVVAAKAGKEVVLLLLEIRYGQQLTQEETRSLELRKVRHAATPFVMPNVKWANRGLARHSVHFDQASLSPF